MYCVKKIGAALVLMVAVMAGIQTVSWAGFTLPPAPQAFDDKVDISSPTAGLIIRVLDNDISSGTLRIVHIGRPQHGMVRISTEGAKPVLTYTPAGSLGDIDRFPYVISDTLGRLSAAIVHVTYKYSPPVNQPPTVNAGDDQTITGSTTTTLHATVTDDGLIQPLRLQWKVLGSTEGIRDFYETGTLNPFVVFSKSGVYTFQLSAFDGQFTVIDTVTVSVELPLPINKAPIVDAGVDQIIQSSMTFLNGKATDDGMIQPLRYEWKVMGSTEGIADFYNTNSLKPTVIFSKPGTYVFQLTAFDGQLRSSDTVTVTVLPTPINRKPTVNAGVDQVIQSSWTVLRGVAIDDGIRQPLQIEWRVAGSSEGITIFNKNRLDTTIVLERPGTYRFILTVFDGEYTVTDEVIVTVLAKAIVNPTPAPAPSPAGSGLQTGSQTKVRKGTDMVLNVHLKTAGQLRLRLQNREGVEITNMDLGGYYAGQQSVEVPTSSMEKGLHRAALLQDDKVIESFYVSIL